MNHISAYFENSRGTRLRYQYWEASSKSYQKVAIVLHGTGYHSGSYPKLVPELVAAHYKVYAFDFAGFGLSPEGSKAAGPKPGDFGHYADDLESFRRFVKSSEGAREIVLVGHSLGALVGLLFLTRYSDVETRLVAVCPSLKPLPARFADLGMSVEKEQNETLSSDPLVVKEFQAAFVEDVKKGQVKAIEAQRSGYSGRKILVLSGEDDRSGDEATARSFQSALVCKASEYKAFPRAGHDIFSEKYGMDAVSEIMAWLDRTAFEHIAP